MKELIWAFMKLCALGVVCAAIAVPLSEKASGEEKFSEKAVNKVVEIHIYKKPSPEVGIKFQRNSMNLPLSLGHGTCSGAFVSATGDILTAKHCVDEPADYEVLTSDRRSYAAVIVATSTLHDLALLHIDRRVTPFFGLAETVTRGQVIYILGSPLALTDVLSTGIVARIDGDATLLDCSALPGNSGGPVFDADDKLVGIVTSVHVVMLGLTHLSEAQGIDSIHYFLKTALKAK